MIPVSREAETALLGAILIQNNILEDIMHDLLPHMFYDRANQMIYKAMVDLHVENKPIDIITISGKLGHQINDCRGIAYLTDLANSTPTVLNAKQHAEIIIKKYQYRELIKVGKEIMEMAAKEEENALDEAEKRVLEIQRKQSKQDFYSAKDISVKVLSDVLEQMGTGKLPGVSWGFDELDLYTGGLMPSDLIIIGARPSMGKTSFALEIVRHIALDLGLPVGVFELEMSKEQLIQRLACNHSQIDSEMVKLRTLKNGTQEFKKFTAAMELIHKSKILIDDTSGLKVTEIINKTRKMKRMYKDLPVIVVDYLQLMGGEGQRREVVEYNSRKLKELAKELNITVIVLSQLSRACEIRNDKRPVLSDLRETGAIEQDADIVAFLYRDEYYNSESKDKGIAEFIIRKQRDGSVGTVKLGWLANCTKFVNYRKIMRR